MGKIVKKKCAWLNPQGKFEVRSCVALQKYILSKTGVHCNVHKTTRYLVFIYLKDGLLETAKVDLPGGVLYCLREEDLYKLVKSIGESKNE